MLHPKLLVMGIVVCVAWLWLVLELVRRRKLTEGLSFVWVVASIVLALCVLFSRGFTSMARLAGIEAPEHAVLVLGIGILAAASLYLCTKVSDLARKVVKLSQEVALLRKQGAEEHSLQEMKEN